MKGDQGIDDPSTRRPRGSNDEKWFVSKSTVVGDHSTQRDRVHLEFIGDRYDSNGVATETGRSRSLHKGVVALSRGVEHRFRGYALQPLVENLWPPVHQRTQQSGQVGLSPAAREGSIGALFGIPKLLGEDLNQPALRLHGKRAMTPRGELRIQSRRYRIAKDAHERWGWIEKNRNSVDEEYGLETSSTLR